MARETARTSPARICCAHSSIFMVQGGADMISLEAADGRKRHGSIMRESRDKFSRRMNQVQMRNRRAQTRVSTLLFAEKLAGDDQFLDFASAFADGAEFDVAVELFGGIILDEAVATVDLHAFVGDADGDFTGEKFGHARFARETERFLIRVPSGLIDEKARSFHFRGHVGEFELNGLKFTDGLAELLALLGIAGGGAERTLRHAERERGDGDAAAVENGEAACKALAFGAEEIGGGNVAVGEDDFRSVAGAEGKFILLLAGTEGWHAFFEDEGAESLRVLGFVRDGHGDAGVCVMTVGGESL